MKTLEWKIVGEEKKGKILRIKINNQKKKLLELSRNNFREKYFH